LILKNHLLHIWQRLRANWRAKKQSSMPYETRTTCWSSLLKIWDISVSSLLIII